MKLFYTDRAVSDIELAMIWYEKQREKLGDEFLDSLEDGIRAILQNPRTYAICHKSFRRYLIKRFPFSIYYSIEEEGMVVHSVFDNRMDPGKLPI